MARPWYNAQCQGRGRCTAQQSSLVEINKRYNSGAGFGGGEKEGAQFCIVIYEYNCETELHRSFGIVVGVLQGLYKFTSQQTCF